MSKWLLKTTEVYRTDSDEEAKELIEKAKKDTMFELTKYSSEYKEVKQKGEVVDSYYITSLSKTFNDPKQPEAHIKATYAVDYGTTEDNSND